MKRYKLDDKEVTADAFINFLKTQLKILQAENVVINEDYEKCKRRIEALEKEKDVLNMMLYDKNQKIKQYENAINDKNRRLKKKENIIKILVNKVNNNSYISTDEDDIEALTDSLVQANKSNEELYKENEELKQMLQKIYNVIGGYNE